MAWLVFKPFSTLNVGHWQQEMNYGIQHPKSSTFENFKIQNPGFKVQTPKSQHQDPYTKIQTSKIQEHKNPTSKIKVNMYPPTWENLSKYYHDTSLT